MPEDVYRQGKRDLHHGFRSGGIEFEHDSCRLDGRGNEWLEKPPDGPRCPKCFAGMAGDAPSGGIVPRKRRVKKRHVAAGAGGTAVVALAATLLSQGGTVIPIASFSSAPTGTAYSAAPSADLTPSPTPAPSLGPVPSFGGSVPAPTPVVIVIRETPRPTRAPHPLPSPSCVHPGTHLGVDPCKWPHQP